MFWNFLNLSSATYLNHEAATIFFFGEVFEFLNHCFLEIGRELNVIGWQIKHEQLHSVKASCHLQAIPGKKDFKRKLYFLTFCVHTKKHSCAFFIYPTLPHWCFKVGRKSFVSKIKQIHFEKLLRSVAKVANNAYRDPHLWIVTKGTDLGHSWFGKIPLDFIETILECLME